MTSRIMANEFGGPEVLAFEPVDVPAPGPGEVTIETRAAGVNPIDIKILGGQMNPDPSVLAAGIGRELSGVVTAVGSGAEGPGGPLAVGDEVVATGFAGTWAEAVTVPAEKAVPKPAGVSWEVAAGSLLTGATAVHMLDAGGVAKGDVVLVHGAAGSVGQIAAQLAVAAGATVVGTAREANHELLRGYGVIPVTYGPGLADRVRVAAPGGVDAALDTIGTDEAVDVSFELVEDPKRVVSIAAFQRADTGIKLLGGGPTADPGTEIRAQAWRTLLPAIADGSLRIVIARTYPLRDAAEAVRYVSEGHAGGKVVLIP
jgi:NADPH:quinone reductase